MKAIQCLKCGKLGHKAKRCRSKTSICMKCSDEHETKNCENDKKRCVNCWGNHGSLSNKCLETKYEKLRRLKSKEQEYVSKYLHNKPAITLEQKFDLIVDKEFKRSVNRIKKQINDMASKSVSKRTGNFYSEHLLFFILNMIIHSRHKVVKYIVWINKKIILFVNIMKELLKTLTIQTVKIWKSHEKNKE